jgi:hypothetical protein
MKSRRDRDRETERRQRGERRGEERGERESYENVTAQLIDLPFLSADLWAAWRAIIVIHNDVRSVHCFRMNNSGD